MVKKIISVILCVFMLSSYLCFNVSAKDNTVVDLTNINIISKTGMPASTEAYKTGSYTMKWGGSDIYRDISLDFTEKDLRD